MLFAEKTGRGKGRKEEPLSAHTQTRERVEEENAIYLCNVHISLSLGVTTQLGGFVSLISMHWKRKEREGGRKKGEWPIDRSFGVKKDFPPRSAHSREFFLEYPSGQ